MSSKADSPPSYEDTLKDPKLNNYPFQTQHDAPLPPPPPYSPSPGMCPGPGFPPAAMPIPTLSAGLSASSPGSQELTQTFITHFC